MSQSQAQNCLNYSTYFGRSAQDEIKGVCTDNQNNCYVIGVTTNTDLPVTPGAFQSVLKSGYDAFIAKFDSCGNLIWCSYLGTSGFDSGEKISFSSDNTIVFCGYTNGNDLSTTSNCFQGSSNGDYDCFIGKFSLNGTPVWLSYFGSTAADLAYDVKLDLNNNIVIGGTSLSPTLYTNASSFQQNGAGQTDAFIARFSPGGNLRFSTFYGGTGSEDIHAIAVDKSCNVIGTGGSFSSNLNTSAGCFQSFSNGGMEIYVIKLDSSGQRIFSTYIGGNSIDDAFGVVTDNSNNIYVSGYSGSANFYTSPGAFQSANAGSFDSYCLKLNSSGVMQWSTLIGGSGGELFGRLAINALNELSLLTETQSTDLPMLGTNNYTLQSGAQDAAIIKISDYGTPFWTSYVGGSMGDNPHDIATIYNNKIICVGLTGSNDFPLSGNTYQNTNNGFQDGFITVQKTGLNPAAGLTEDEFVFSPALFYDNISQYIRIKTAKRELFSFEIHDIFGRLLNSGRSETDVIDVSFLQQGVFFIRITSETQMNLVLKFVKE